MPFPMLGKQGYLIKGLMALYLIVMIGDTTIAIAAVTHDLQWPVQNYQMDTFIATAVISTMFQATAWYVTREFVASAINLNTKMTLQILADISLPMMFSSIFALLHAFTNNFLFHCLFLSMGAVAIRNYGKLTDS